MTHTHVISTSTCYFEHTLHLLQHELSPRAHLAAQHIQYDRRMRLSAGLAVGVGCASLAQVSSFAFVPSATSVSTSATQQQVRPESLHLCFLDFACVRVHLTQLEMIPATGESRVRYGTRTALLVLKADTP